MTNKNWKVRVELYNELQSGYKVMMPRSKTFKNSFEIQKKNSKKNVFQQGGPDAEKLSKYLVPMIQDSNPQAQSQALENLELFLRQKVGGRLQGKDVDVQELMQALLDNVVSRAASAKKGQAVVLLACKAFGVETVLDALLVCSTHKAKHKAVPALDMVNLLIATFGLKSHSPSAPKTAHIIKSVAATVQASDPAIRKAAFQVLVLLHQVIGEPLLENLQQVQGLRAAQLGTLRDMLVKSGSEQAAGEKENTVVVVTAPPTPVRATEPPPVLVEAIVSEAAPADYECPIVSDEVWTSLVSSLGTGEWKDRIVALDRVLELKTLSVDQAMVIIEMMISKSAHFINDSHSVIVAKSIALLTGAMKAAQNDDRYTSVCKRMCLLLLDRVKENKGAIVSASEEALLLLRVDAADLGDILTSLMTHTIPKVRQRGIQWIESLVVASKKGWLRPVLRNVATIVGEAFGDQSADVRKAAASLLQHLSAIYGKETLTALLFGESGAASKMGAARQVQIRKLLESTSVTITVANTPAKEPESAQPSPAKASSPYKPPVQQQQPVQPPSIVQPVQPRAAVIPSNPLQEWMQYSQFVECQLKNLVGLREQHELLGRRAKELERENAALKSQVGEFREVAKMLEDRAVELEEAAGGLPSTEDIAALSLEELTVLEAQYQDVILQITKQKAVRLEEMARKNGCTGCGKPREKSTVLFPCRHVVCNACGATVAKCPDCKSNVQQRFELAD